MLDPEIIGFGNEQGLIILKVVNLKMTKKVFIITKMN